MDRGPGIAASEQASLFRRYATLSSQPTGGESSTGLGLALAKQKARAMGGDLWYDDRDGGGACFTLELPRVE
jgi:two-component system, sensor histidine kinase and response regulator